MNRYRLIYTLLLTALMASTNASAGVTVKGNVYGGGNKADVKTNTTVNMGGGQVEGNVYGGGNLGDVGTINKEAPNMNYKWTNETGVLGDDYTYNNTGVCTVSITNGTIGRVEGNQDEDHGNVFGGGKGLEDTYECEKAMVYKATVIIGNGTVKRNTYGGGKVGRVENDTRVTIGLGGESDGSTEYYEKQTGEGGTVTYNKVTVAAGQSVIGKYVRSGVEGSYVYTLIEANAHPVVEGCVFGAGAGVDTHGYSALVRGDASVTVQGNASVKKNVYGGGEKATVGRYWVSVVAEDPTDHAPSTMPPGMPYKTKGGGACTVKVLDNAVIGPDGAASETAGHVFGAGQGIAPSHYLGNVEVLTDTTYMPKRMMRYSTTSYSEDDHKKTWEYYGEGTEFVWDYFNTREKYFNFLQTLALATETHVTINGTASPTSVKGSVYGGSESGFVQDDTEVTIESGVIGATGSFGNVFGGGKGLATFAEAGKVKGNTNVAISGGTMYGTVYGGGELGDVGTITKTDIRNYTWKANTGKCEVEITGTSADIKGNVFGAGKGEPDTFWCEKAMADNTSVSITNGTVGLNVYGGGEKGRVEHDAEVTIGPETGTCTLDIKGSVFGAGKGVVTHGYSALVRGNTTVTVQSNAVVEKSIYGGGEIASVGKYGLDAKGMPSELKGGGDCVVTILGAVQIGTNGGGNVFGAGKGETPIWVYNSGDKSGWSKRMMTHNSSYKLADKGTKWDYSDATEQYVWEYFPSSTQFSKYLETLALATNPTVTINGTIDGTGTTYTVNGSVYGGGEKGITKGAVIVNINGGTIAKDVYGGGALADSNTGNWSPNKNFVEADVQTGASVTGYFTKGDSYTLITDGAAVAQDGATYYSYNEGTETYEVVTGLTAGSSSVTGYYTKSDVYTQITDDEEVAVSGKVYYETQGGWTDASGTAWKKTIVNLLGGTIKGDAYGGGLGQKTGFNSASSDIEATVWGDIVVTLNGTKFNITNYTDEGHTDVVNSGRVFGCNNLLGSPQGDVTVTVERTVAGNIQRTTAENLANNKAKMDAHPDNYKSIEGYVPPTYEVAAVYGGGNLAPYTTTGKKAHVIINGCGNTSIETVYGGGNAARVPETDVDVNGTYEIGAVFGGGNGKDMYKNDSGWQPNPGANVGTVEQRGNANTLIYGGTVHEAYGGSNELGTVYGDVVIDIADSGLKPGQTGYCALDVAQLVGAGKNADVNGDMKIVMGCKPSEKIPIVFGGADNANVNGDVELTVTSGNFGKIFGGNNNGGRIKGHIILNIEETTCIPLNIDHLYLCGNNAAYSQYGYYVKTTKTEGTPVGDPSETPVLTSAGKLDLIPRESATDSHKAVKTYSYNESGVPTWTVYSGEGEDKCEYAAPVLNVISCTSIGEVFGGGYGASATVYGNPTVNINMTPGAHADEIDRDKDGNADGNANALGTIGDVYGGGDAAAVYGNTTVNIGTITSTSVHTFDLVNGEYKVQYQADGVTPIMEPKTVTGAYITGDVYGGGKLANVGAYHEVTSGTTTTDVVDIEGSTSVNIGIKKTEILDDYDKPTGMFSYSGLTFAEGAFGIKIGGNVYGGGKGEAKESGEGAFRCGKAMVTKNTNVTIYNGTIGDGAADHGHVYGGGEKGRVQENTTVTIGCENDANSAPVIMGNVFGAGKGVNTHGYSALTRGNSYVTVQGEAKVKKSVYGGGEIASVGKYNINAQGLPESLANQNSGYCTVIVRDNAVIGPDAAMVMTADGYPDDMGHVFGAGKGVLPYEGYADNAKAWRVTPGNTKQEYLSKNEAIAGTDEKSYLPYVETLGLATQTYVTIEENAFVKGSVYGGSENGYVQHDTQVNIQGNCQIGNGYVQMDNNGIYLDKLETPEIPMGVNRPYTAAEWAAGNLIPDATKEPDLYALVHDKYYNDHSLPECASWPYGQKTGDDKYAPWDKYYGTNGYDSKGGRTTADDGHTFYGNVFGGGSGVIPYRPGQWHPEAGSVGGNTVVNITGGHILTNIYGGNELTDVYGKCTVNFGGTATLGVPRTPKQIAAHPLTCYLFGAGKGDQRVLFNKKTNVDDVEVNITGGWIYGSVFGGGEDGHVHHNVTMTISEADYATDNTKTRTKIGTWGTTYVDGNVFGGGRGFGADAYTAGNVAGTVTMNILGGTMLGSIYGGGRLGSVGYGLFDEGADGYGEMCDDNTSEVSNPISADNFKRGYVYMTIGNNDGTGPIIGNTWEYKIPSASNGPMTTGEDPVPTLPSDIKTWTAANWTTWREYNHVPKTEFEYNESKGYYMLTHTKGGNVFAGGMGNFYKQDGSTYINGVDWWKLGNVKSTTLTIKGGTIKSNVYGGGELGQVVGSHTTKNSANQDINAGTEITIQGSNTVIGTEVKDGSNVTQYTFGSVFGGGYGSLLDEITVNNGTSTVTSKPKFIAGLVKEDTKIDMQDGAVKASIYGGGEMASVGESTTSGETTTVTGSTYVAVSGGTVGIAPIDVSGVKRYFGGAKMGNVYGGGSGHNNTVRSGKIFKNTNVTISGGTIYHNIYGGGAYGTVGEFNYTEDPNENNKVIGVHSLKASGSGVATVTVTGGIIGYDGKENGMVFGSSRGDINRPGARDDHTAWVYDTHVTIGTSGSNSGPQINGTVYGSGENGHVFNNTEVNIHSGTIGIYNSTDAGYTVTSNGKSYSGAEYPYRGNVYGGGCGTDKYYSNPALETHDGNGQLYNSLAGIVYGNTTVNITGGHVVRNVYGAGAMGSVGKVVTTTTNNVATTSITSGGKTTINISGGTVGVDGNNNGNVFGAARGDATTTQTDVALVQSTGVSIGGTADVKGSVYGGGEVGDVKGNTTVEVQGGAIAKNVFGGGKGSDHNFTCDKAMVGVNDEGKDVSNPGDNEYKDKGTIVTISNGTIGTLGTNNQLAENTGNVYGGGEIGRVEWNTQVKIGIGEGEGTFAPIIYGNVYGAGKGLATHGYSALVRGNCTVTVQGGAKVGHNVYGGGENSTAGRYWVKNINNIDAQKKPIPGAPTPPDDLPDGMPYKQQSGGICSVTIQGEAEIGYNGAAADAGHVYGAGKGVKPSFTLGTTDRMVNDANGGSYVAFEDERDKVTNEVVKTAEELYLEFLQTLALATNSSVTIGESAQVKGSVFGGSESGFVQHDTNVTINNGTIGTTASYGNVFGGGRGLEEFAEAGKVKGNTRVTINNGTMYGNVYGGGNLGDVGLITKPADYNYTWKQTDGTTANTSENNNITGTSNNTGICKVIITGGTIGISGVDSQEHGNVFGAGKGTGITWWCEKAIVFATDVKVSGSTVVYGNVYGGGQVGRVEDDGKVTIGTPGASGEGSEPDIKGDVFGAGAGLQTHGYSALLRGNAEVTVQGIAQVGGSVYGGGEIASVGRFTVVKGLPTKPETGGICIVNIKDNAKIGSSGTDHHVFGACKGVTPEYNGTGENYKNFKSMQTEENGAKGTETEDWDYYKSYSSDYEGTKFVWVYYKTEADYLAFLKTLALTSHPHVTIGGTWTPNETTGTITPAGAPSVFGSVYGGGQRGVTLGHVDVNIIGGTVKLDVYGGGALADTNLGNWDVNGYVLATALNDGESITDLYSRTGTEGNYTYTKIKDSDTPFASNTYYRQQATWAHDTGSAYYKTTVDLTGGTIDGNVYGGGHGNATTEAEVYGDVEVKLNEAVANDGCKVKGQIFGCNNMNGSPKGGVTVHVYKTVGYDTDHQRSGTKNNTTYEVAAVFGGGNQAAYNPQEPDDAKSVANVIIDGCDQTSIETVYGGGNAASAPATHVTVNGCYEIGTVFGGGYGAGENNPGANVGYKSDGTTPYGLGTTTVDLFGGVVHEAFGSSNTRGIVREEAHVNLDEKKDGNGNVCCPMLLDEVYGGGNEAYMEGGTKVDLGCITKLKTIYGGAKNANVNGDINMTIQSGTYDRVFGGNNVGGTISGTITVNIEETGCHPIIIGQLFGGGNQAAYTAPFEPGSTEERQPGPTINVRSFTSIGEIYGGGYGQTAVVTGDTYVNVNECVGDHDGEDTHTDANDAIKQISFTEYVRTADGGFELDGNGDKVTRNVTVDVFMPLHTPSTNDVKRIGAIHRIFGGGNAANVDGNTHVKIGTLSQTTFVTPKTASETDRTKAVVGADIRDNVYGGGNQADVTGDTEVIIGQEGQGD